MEETAYVGVNVDIEGVERVTGGFQQIGDASVDMGRKVADSTKQMENAGESTRRLETNQRMLMLTSAGLIANSMQLGDIMDRMANGQIDAGRAALLLTMNFLQLGSQLYILHTRYGELITAKTANLALDVKQAGAAIAGAAAEGMRTAATWARTVAEKAKAVALAIAHALEGPWGWAILAGAAAAAGVGIALANRVPAMAEGGVVTKPTYALIGEWGSEAVIPLSKITTSNRVENRPVNVYIYNPTFRNRADMEYMGQALRRGVE